MEFFSDKVQKAYRQWANGGVYVCPNCDGDNPLCGDDYQSQECEIHEAERLEFEEQSVMGNRYENSITNE